MLNVTDKVVNSKLLKKILSIRVFDLSVTLVGCRTSGIKKYEHSIIELRIVRFNVDFH